VAENAFLWREFMAVQNLVSASIASETKDEILKSVTAIRGKLGFLLNLQASEVSGLFKAGKELAPFLDGCHSVAQAHPEILSGVFDQAEFDRDYQLAQDLGAIADAVGQLHEALGHTLTAVRSDTLLAALDVYSAVKTNKAKVPGLNTVSDSLSRYFARSPRTVVTAAR
jgi:hypothetical protein